ncbi:hypothetical protein RUA4292_01461 [Ruegeria atlantica]|uniref:Uncharacterized protein n=1 Tax=Ruegeria atlantica TaxID=81569 RepID=A0A0P1ECB6_9RHOB|nr:hypothetical protein RUA4292_01461 [Ruegeria atlantica]
MQQYRILMEIDCVPRFSIQVSLACMSPFATGFLNRGGFRNPGRLLLSYRRDMRIASCSTTEKPPFLGASGGRSGKNRSS